jgi:hypothetical protein
VPSKSVRVQRARCAALARFRHADDPVLIAARKRLRFELCVQNVEQTVAAASPLTPEDRDRLISILDRGAA